MTSSSPHEPAYLTALEKALSEGDQADPHVRAGYAALAAGKEAEGLWLLERALEIDSRLRFLQQKIAALRENGVRSVTPPGFVGPETPARPVASEPNVAEPTKPAAPAPSPTPPAAAPTSGEAPKAMSVDPTKKHKPIDFYDSQAGKDDPQLTKAYEDAVQAAKDAPTDANLYVKAGYAAVVIARHADALTHFRAALDIDPRLKFLQPKINELVHRVGPSSIPGSSNLRFAQMGPIPPDAIPVAELLPPPSPDPPPPATSSSPAVPSESLLPPAPAHDPIALFERHGKARKRVQANPDDPEAHLELAGVAEKMGRRNEARNALERVLELDPSRSELADRMAALATPSPPPPAETPAATEPPPAEVVAAASDLSVRDAQALWEKHERARKVLDEYPLDPAAHLALAEAADGLGRRQEAMRHYRQVLETNPSRQDLADRIAELERESQGVVTEAAAPAKGPSSSVARVLDEIHKAREEAEKPRPSFAGTLHMALAFPFRGQGLALFLVGSVSFAIFRLIASGAGCMGLPLVLFLWGYLFAYYVKVLKAGACGQTESPGWPDPLSPIDMVVDAVRLWLAALVGYLPLIFLFAVYFQTVLGPTLAAAVPTAQAAMSKHMPLPGQLPPGYREEIAQLPEEMRPPGFDRGLFGETLGEAPSPIVAPHWIWHVVFLPLLLLAALVGSLYTPMAWLVASMYNSFLAAWQIPFVLSSLRKIWADYLIAFVAMVVLNATVGAVETGIFFLSNLLSIIPSMAVYALKIPLLFVPSAAELYGMSVIFFMLGRLYYCNEKKLLWFELDTKGPKPGSYVKDGGPGRSAAAPENAPS